MAHKPNMVEEVVSNFTVKTLPVIKINPDYKGINENMQLLHANTETILTPKG